MKEIQSVYTIDMELQRVVALNLSRIRGEMSRKALATKAGVSYQHIYEIEEEIKKPSLKVLEKLSKALDVELSELLSAKESTPKPIKISSALRMMASIPDEIYELAEKLGDSKNDVWEEIAGFLEDEIAYGKKEKSSQR